MILRVLASLAASGLALLGASTALALDPPHDIPTSGIECITCHLPHGAPGGTLTVADGNANVCMTCHVPAGQASERPFAAVNQSLAPMPAATGWTWSTASGTSHRWDSGPSGHVKPAASNTSTGRVASGGTFSGRIEEQYTITISTAGQTGVARFNWTSLRDGSGSSVATGASVTIGSKGLSLAFADGTASPSFVVGNQWTLYARSDLRLPVTTTGSFERPMGQRVMRERLPNNNPIGDPKVVCSTCHDQHSQQHPPFDPTAPLFGGPGTGWLATGNGRHFQRVPNDSGQMCEVCHSERHKQQLSTQSGNLTHPVSVPIPSSGAFRTPPDLPMSAAGQVECLTCHAPHFFPTSPAGHSTEGFLLRRSVNELCQQCHTNANTTAGSHFNASTGALWGGNRNRAANSGQQLDAFTATSFPKHTSAQRGACINCHWPHGWQDAVTGANDYPKLWVERYDTSKAPADLPQGSAGEALCYACHTGSGIGGDTPATSNLEAEFQKGSPPPSSLPSPDNSSVYRHPVNDNEQRNGPGGTRRVVECVDCHNPHKATAVDRHAGVSGVALDNSAVDAGTRTLRQYEVCLKCHGATYNSTRTGPSASQPWTTDKRLDFQTTNSAYHPVVQPGRNKSANLANQLSAAGLDTNQTIRCTDCHNSNAYSGTTGRVVEVTATGPVGPHGSTNDTILRAQFGKSYTSTGWNSANAALCFRCHDSTQLFGSGTGFTDRGSVGQYRRGNLHAYHLTNKGATASCMSCHYDIHSNRSASNTRYRWMSNGTAVNDGTGLGNGLYASPPAGLKTKLVNFAPDVTGNSAGGSPTTLPMWEIDDVTRVRKCSINCHSKNMDYDRAWYQPTAASDDPSHVYRATTTGLVSSVNPSTVAQSVTFTATISGTSITPTGSVAFVDGPVTLCAASAISGSAPYTATCTVSGGTFTAGGHGVVAIYTGDADDGASTSAALVQTVN